MKTMQKLSSRAFTIIELLIVIGIIVLLASMLIPCLAKAKVKAVQASCLCNQKQFGAAFTMYVSDNSSRLPFMTVGTGHANVGGYWQVSYSSLSTWPTSDAALADVQRDLKTNSLLFAYFPSVTVNHCPGDPRLNNTLIMTNANARGWAYDSYALTQNIAGFGEYGARSFSHITDIRRISDCLIVAERVDSRGCNIDAFYWNNSGPGFAQKLSSVFGIYHGKVGTFSFADGHAEGHKWIDPNIIKSGLAANQPGVVAYQYGQAATPAPSTTGLDYAWVQEHWVDPSNP